MTWKYLPVLNACIQVTVTIGLGAVLSYFKMFDKSFVPAATRFVFYVGLPSLVILGIGIGVDFYSKAFIWKYIFGFLILRAIALVMSFGSVVIRRKQSPSASGGIGQVAVQWLCLTWISTVIMGVPILTALFNNPQEGRFYGLLAGISSFIFQLPLQLFFLECHALEQDQLVSTTSSGKQTASEKDIEPGHAASADLIESERNPSEKDIEPGLAANAVLIEPERNPIAENESTLNVAESTEVQVKNAGNRWFMCDSLTSNTHLWTKVLFRICKNPVLWGIFVGFLLSLTTIGQRYLNPKGDDYVEGLDWIRATLSWLSACVSPVSLFAMGIWMQQQGRHLVTIKPLHLSLYMLSKLVIVPLIMVGLAKALNLSDRDGRAAVLIASLPISLASFVLGEQYSIGKDVLSANVAVGSLLMLPTVIIWNLVMDAVDLFPDYMEE